MAGEPARPLAVAEDRNAPEVESAYQNAPGGGSFTSQVTPMDR